MGNETSQDQPSDSDHPGVPHPTMPPRSSTPLSEACEVASVCSRRPSVSSLGQFDDPPEVDLSHLSAEERAKIAAVMERARQAQDEEAERIRELEEDFQASCLARSEYERAYDTTDLCPVCDTTELTGENVNVCSNCEAFVCPNCGAYDSNSTTKLQEWVCLLCQKQRQTQQQELRDADQPEPTETEQHLPGPVVGDTSHAEILDTGQPVLHKQEKPYNTQHDLQTKPDTNYARQPEVEPPHIASAGQAKVQQKDNHGAGDPNLLAAEDYYAAQQDLRMSNTCYEGETEKHGADAYYAATQRGQIQSDTHCESNPRDLYSGNSGNHDEQTTDARYSRPREPNGEVMTSLHAICRTTSLQDGLAEAADSTSACAAIRRSFDAPCVTDYHELSDSSDEEVGRLVSDYERMQRGVAGLTEQGDSFRSGDQPSGRRGMTDANAELGYEDAYRLDWARGDADIRDGDIVNNGDEDFAGDAFDRGRGKTSRPRQLVLGEKSTERAPTSSQHRELGGHSGPLGDTAEKTGRPTDERGMMPAEHATGVHQQMTSLPSHVVDGRDTQRWPSSQPLGQTTTAAPRHEAVDGQSSPAETADRHDGLRKKKPSALEKVSVNEADSDKRVSPSRRSPRSPPRSPSWMRYRDGSSRSSPNRTLSPPISPTARYQSSLPDNTHGDCDDSYDGDYFTYAGNYMHDQGKIGDATLSYNDRAQPKPARSFSGQRSLSDDAIEMESLDLAAFAAAVASDTAHLTNLSVSPTQHEILASDATHDDFSPPTSIGSGDLDALPEPKPKNIDHQGNKRQKTKPPPTDWSPVTDLSPILDVSPSIEAIEQAEMFRMRTSDRTPQSTQDAANGETRYLTQSLKRYQHFDDISKIGNGVLQANDETDASRDMLGDFAVGDIKSAREISNEHRGSGRVQVVGYMQPPVAVTPPVTFMQTASRTPDVTHVTPTQTTQRTPETTLVTLTQTAPVTLTQTPDVTPVTLTQTTPITLTQAIHRTPDVTPVTLTQTTRRTPDVPPVTLTQITRRTPDVTPVTLTQITRRTPDITPVTLSQTTPVTLSQPTPVTLTQTSRPTPDVTPVTLTQSSRPTPQDVTNTLGRLADTRQTLTETVPGREEDRRADKNKVHKSAESLSKETRPAMHPDTSAIPHSSLQTSDEQAQAEIRRAEEKKIRRKLPPLPPPDGAIVAKPDRHSPQTPDKELLRQRLRQRQAENRRPQKQQFTNVEDKSKPDVTSRVRAPPLDDKPQTRTHPHPPVILSKPSIIPHTPGASKQVNTTSVPAPRTQSPPVNIATKAGKQSPQILPAMTCLGRVYVNGVRPPATVATLSSGNATRPSSIVDQSTSAIRPRARMQPREEKTTVVRGILVPVDVKFLKQRLKEEIQIVTASRRLRIDEQDEIRRMEMLLAQRERQRVAAEAEAAAAKQRTSGSRTDRTSLAMQTKERGNGFTGGTLNQNGATPSQQRVVSPHALPRRHKHKRQVSDPVVTKFSPIEEDRDVEHAMNAKMRADFDTVRRPEVRHVEVSTRTEQTRNSPNVFVTQVCKQPIPSSKLSASLSRSSEVLHEYSIVERDARLMNSQSESCLPVTTPPQCRTPTFEERRKKERRKNELQQEIDKRKRQLEEAMLLAEVNNVEPEVHDICFQHVRAADKAAAGIIKPIDYGPTEAEEYYSDMIYSEPNDEELSYSSTEYLAHKCDWYPRVGHSHPTYGPVEFLSDSEYDIQCRSRHVNQNLLTTVGSAPSLGYQMAAQQQADPLNTMYRADSERSLGDSDENVMEGGVTIKQHVDQRPPAPANRNRSKYDFPTKRILLTRDPKDRVLKGNTMGMRIVGGKLIPGGGGEVGAYVAAIYPGGVAEQLHGELREGDQVLEWNGIPLTGKTFEEVQRTIAQPNGELELVVRPGAEMTEQKHSTTMSTLCSDSCHSSYDNLDSVSEDNEYEHLPDAGIDLDPTKLSPGASVTSSQPDLDMTPSLSTSASSEQTDPASTDSPSDAAAKPHVTSRDASVGRQQKQADTLPDSRQDTNYGDIQLQLSHDDYDGTLNVHVIQARNLQPKDKNGFSDPYVKVYLLPGRSPEKKRRTKYIARSLDPEWHQTLVFMNIPRVQLVSKTLEVTVWDYDRFMPNDFLGEVLIELSERCSLDNKPHWYQLRPHSDTTDFASRSPPPGGASSAPKSPSHKRDPKEKSPKNRRQTKRDPSPAGEPASSKFSLGLGRRKGQGGSDAERHKT